MPFKNAYLLIICDTFVCKFFCIKLLAMLLYVYPMNFLSIILLWFIRIYSSLFWQPLSLLFQSLIGGSQFGMFMFNFDCWNAMKVKSMSVINLYQYLSYCFLFCLRVEERTGLHTLYCLVHDRFHKSLNLSERQIEHCLTKKLHKENTVVYYVLLCFLQILLKLISMQLCFMEVHGEKPSPSRQYFWKVVTWTMTEWSVGVACTSILWSLRNNFIISWIPFIILFMGAYWF